MNEINQINLDRVANVVKALINLGVNKFFKKLENDFLGDLDPEDREAIKKILMNNESSTKISKPKK